MRLFLLTALTMVAFAANSVLNRAALVDGGIDPVTFGAVRLVAGALMLWAMVAVRGGRPGGTWPGAVALFVYMFGFSLAYLTLDAGVGALILFGMVQITMFAGGFWGGERPPLLRWIGGAVAVSGLVWLLWPGHGAPLSLPHATAMALAGVGWGVYSLIGRGGSDPLAGTAGNFLRAAPFGLAAALLLSFDDLHATTAMGLALACLSGAVTSGLGYALWYRVLPALSPSVAAVAQLTVPVIAMAGGAVLLAESVTLAFVLAAALVLGGVALSVLARQR